MSPETPKYCITLIHGTFAPNAPWTREESPLCTILREQLGASVAFSSLNWCGCNSQHARLAASWQLRERLLANSRRFPDAAQYIIAHSHGGNVSLAALESPEVGHDVRGLICLATPFLHYRRRRYVLMLSLLVFGLLCALCFVVLGSATGSVAEGRPLQDNVLILFSKLRGGHPSWIPFAELALVVCCAWIVARWIVQRCSVWIERQQSHTQHHYPMPENLPFPILGIALPFDEARIVLRGWWRLTELPSCLGHPVCIFTFMIGGFFGQQKYSEKALRAAELTAFSNEWVWIWSWNLILAPATAFVVILILQVLIFSTGCAHALGYGGGLTTAWFGSLNAREKPAWLREQFSVLPVSAKQVKSEIKWRLFRTLRHSVLYEAPTVIRGIAEWIKKQAATPRTSI